jgi:DNA repair protein RecO (recombination protein O)
VTGLYRDHGIVLRTYKLGEADRIVVFITEGHGKVRAVAKGVRKTKSKFGSRLEPCSHVALQLYEGRGELDTVTQAESVDHFRPIRDDFDRIGRATAMLEAVDQMGLERESNPQLYRMLLGALRSLAAQDNPLVVSAFFLKLLSLEGLRPQLDECVQCGQAPPDVVLVAFDPHAGGALCPSCRRGRAVSPAALELMQSILNGRLTAALAEPVTPATYEVATVATDVMEHHLERRLRSLHVLDRS